MAAALVEATPADCEKTVVLRDRRKYVVELGVQHADWLHALQVSVRDYHLSHGAHVSRALPIETFHAKTHRARRHVAYGISQFFEFERGALSGNWIIVEGPQRFKWRDW